MTRAKGSSLSGSWPRTESERISTPTLFAAFFYPEELYLSGDAAQFAHAAHRFLHVPFLGAMEDDCLVRVDAF